MNDAKLARLAPLSGVAFVVLLVVGVVLINNYDYLPPPEEIRTFYEDAPTRIQAGAYLVVVSGFFLMWFAGSLRGALRPAEGGTGRLSALAFGGGLASGTLLIVGYAAMSAAASRAGTAAGFGADPPTALHDLYSVVTGLGMPVGFALMVGASAVVSLRNRVFPPWLSWVSAILAVGLLSPYGWVFLVVGILWVAVLSLALYLSSRGEVSAPAP